MCTPSVDEELLEASFDGIVEKVQLLLDAGANINARDTVSTSAPTVLEEAVCQGHFEVVKLLVSRGAEINVVNPRCETTLMLACGAFSRDPRIVKFLIQHGADIHARDRQGHTALWYATNSYAPNPEPIIKVLHDAGLVHF